LAVTYYIFIGVALLRRDTSNLKITATVEWRLLPTDGRIIRVLASVVELVLSREIWRGRLFCVLVICFENSEAYLIIILYDLWWQ